MGRSYRKNIYEIIIKCTKFLKSELYGLRINQLFLSAHDIKLLWPLKLCNIYHLRWTLPKIEDLYCRNEFTDHGMGGQLMWLLNLILSKGWNPHDPPFLYNTKVQSTHRKSKSKLCNVWKILETNKYQFDMEKYTCTRLLQNTCLFPLDISLRGHCISNKFTWIWSNRVFNVFLKLLQVNTKIDCTVDELFCSSQNESKIQIVHFFMKALSFNFIMCSIWFLYTVNTIMLS